MSLTESIVEEAALTWFGELGYAVGPLREAIRRLNSANLSCVFAPLRDTVLPKLLSGELSVAQFTGSPEANA
jgi:hypothetical protein